MKDLLEIIKQAGTLPTPTLFFFGVCVIAYLAYFSWKNHFSESVTLEKQKRKLELIKLALEIEALRKQYPSSETTLANEPIDNVFGLVRESKNVKVLSSFKSFSKHPFKWLIGILTQRPKWLAYSITSGLTASVYPVVIICYTLLHLPPNTSALTLHTVFMIQLGLCAVTVILGAILGTIVAAIFKLYDIPLALMNGLILGYVFFQLSAVTFNLIVQLHLVFLNAH